MKLSPHIFRAYDIRGVFGEDLSVEVMLRAGEAFGAYLREKGLKSAVVGNDVRATSPMLAKAFIAGVLSCGVDVTDVGTGSFGGVVFSGWILRKDAIAFITASHLPPEWNGVKLYDGDGIGYSEEALKRIKELAFEGVAPAVWSEVGEYHATSLINEYIEYLVSKFDVEGVSVALDCGNGSMCLVAPELFRRAGMRVLSLFSNVDPRFPNRPAEPDEEHLTALKKHIKGSDFGVAFDGDGDRAVIFDEKGRLLAPDQCGVLIAKDLLSEGGSKVVLANVECSMLIERELKPLGARVIRIPVGHTFLTLEAKRKNAILGIESSGHFVMPSYLPFDDAMLVPLKLAEILAKSGRKLSELADEVPKLPKARTDLECSDATKFKVIESLAKKFSQEYGEDRVDTLDGVRVELDDGWALVRASNTSPLIRVTVEATTSKRMEELKRKFVTATKNEISTVSL
ncbi:MAG TPA: hypothetical protein ENF26_01570 [Methanomicrobia archaeon]|nr:hypothetical protein [Methanomicrobia archaeon]HEX58822.1 hypothetical protein [Methanomicrobia archaeon]